MYEKDGHALINAFKNLDSKTINWCNTFDIMDATKTTNIHVFDCTYENLLTGYLEYDKSIPYWDHILYEEDYLDDQDRDLIDKMNDENSEWHPKNIPHLGREHPLCNGVSEMIRDGASRSDMINLITRMLNH